MRAVTKAEKKHWDYLCNHIGCIACMIDGIRNTHVSIHHCDGRTKPDCHKKVIPLCAEHHQTGGMDAPSIHPYKARFVAKYGTEQQLMDICNSYYES